ncbi:IS66 family insertion sequence element accessory protein TnpB [Lachnospiraceae bacterium ZAX-1]
MDTRKIAREYRLARWAEALREQKASGQSKDEWCKANEVSRNQYFYWQRKLRETAYEQLSATQNEAVQTGLAVPEFTEIRIAEPVAATTQPEVFQPSTIRVEVSGIQISADSTYPPEKLAQLLRELTRRC